jgi:hypothetical protein
MQSKVSMEKENHKNTESESESFETHDPLYLCATLLGDQCKDDRP